MRAAAALALLAAAVLATGCATRSQDVQPLPTDPAAFARWDCLRLADELDTVQRRAADLAWTVDERAGRNVVALGLGVSVFWPALLALRPAEPEAGELARLRGRYEALNLAAQRAGCAALAGELSAAQAAALPVAVGERLVYEERTDARRPAREWVLAVQALRRGEIAYRVLQGAGAPGLWRHDPSGNTLEAPASALQWPRLLRAEMVLGQLVGGDLLLPEDPLARARLRGQVVAAGPQTVAGRRFDVLVVELMGDVQRGDASSRADGAIVVDRASGVLLRLDLRSSDPAFNLQRRLVRVE